MPISRSDQDLQSVHQLPADLSHDLSHTMNRNQKPNISTATLNSAMSSSAATVDSGRSSVKGQKPQKGKFSYSSEADASVNNATSEMITKIDALFRIKHKHALTAGFERLVPLSIYTRSPELRASLEKVMPELLAKPSAHEHSGPLSMQESSSRNENDHEGAEVSSALADGPPAEIDLKMSLYAHKQTARDERAAKSVIRLSNAILPLLDFYHNSLDLTATAPKASTPPIPGTGKHKAQAARKSAASSLGIVTNEIVVQEVHHAFDAVLQQIHRLETSTATGSTEPLHLHRHGHGHGMAETVSSVPSLPPPPPPLVDVMMQENNEKVYAHIASLEKQLHNVHDSKKRQYESMLEQLRTSERQNSALKKKLEVSQQQKDEFIQVAVDKEKQLQSSLVHLSVAQEEIKHLKIQNAKIPQQKRDHQNEINKAAQQNSKYSAGQFIKLSAQIDSLREELQRERQRSQKESERLKATAEEATSKAAFADIVITQLQNRIANSNYFTLHPADRPLEYPPHPAAAHAVLSPEDGAGSPTDLDDSNLYVDAQVDPSALPQTGQTAPAGLHGHSDGLSTISSGSSKHSTLESGDGNDVAHTKSAPSHPAHSQPVDVHRVSTTDSHKAHGRTRSTSQSGKPAGSHRPSSKHSAPQTPSARDLEMDKDRSVRESVVTSPTRASYHRTLATVEQFVPTGSTAGTSHNTSMNATAGQNTTAHTLPSASGQGSNNQMKLPWRPSTPNASPAHIRTGYYQQTKYPKGYPAHSHHILQEDGFMFNNHTRSENRSPVRSIRPKKFSASSSGSLFNDTTNSRQRSASVSPFRRSTSPSALYAARHRDVHYNKHVPEQIPSAKVYRELNTGKCTYCTHNLLELWTRKFGPPIGAPEDGSDHESDTSSGDVDQQAHLKHSKGKSPRSTLLNSDGLSTPKRGKKSKRSKGSKSKAKKHKPERDDDSASETSSSESSEECSAEGPGDDAGGRQSATVEESPKRTADVGGPFTAVLDSAGNPISYALGRSDADDHVAGIHLSGKINPQLLPPRIEIARSMSSHSQHASVHWQPEQGGHSGEASIHKHHMTPHSVHRDAVRHSRDFVDEMSAITETSEQDHSQSQPHRHSSDAHKHHASASASGVDIRSKAGTPLSSADRSMGIADAGMSPPPPPPANRHHPSHSGDQSAGGDHSHHQPSRATPVLHGGSTPHSHTSTHASHHSAHHSAHNSHHSVHQSAHHSSHAAAHESALHSSRDPQTQPHATAEPAADSSNETLTSFPVGPTNSATSQHTAQLLQKLRARNIHPKIYLTTADTRNATISALTTQCNQLVREFNEILMTLGNEILVSENVKLDYKQEIHESANLVSELQKKVNTLQSENDSLYETVSANQAEKESLGKRHEELVYSIQEELLQARVENEDLVEETESLKHQLRDSMHQPYSASGIADQLEGADHFATRSRSHSHDHRDARSRSTSPHHGHTYLRSRSQSSAHEENTLHRHDQQRITMLEDEVAQYKTMHHELSVEQEKCKEQLFAVEAELAEARQQLTESGAAGHSIHHQSHNHGHSEHHDHHRSSHSSILEDQLAEARQKAADTEAINQVQSQLLQQKDFQVQQLKDNIFTQQQQFAALQQQHMDMHSRLAGQSAVQHVTHTTSTDSHHHGAGHASGHSVPPIHTVHSGASSPQSHAPSHHSQSHHVGIAASSDSHSQLAALKQKLDATHRELEEVKRANQQGTALHLNYPSAGSSSGSVAGSVVGSLAESVRGHASHHGTHPAHYHHNSMPASPMSVNSAISGGTSVSSMMNSSAHGHNAYQGDLQYISHLDVIMEEGSVRTSSNTAPSAATPRGVNMHAAHTPMHGATHINQNDDRSRASQHSHAVQGQAHDQHAAENGSDKSEYSNQQGTPLHTMLNQHYGYHQAQDDAVSEDMNRQITSMTATNAALTSRVTQLEQRLRHSELRCKLLTDQIKSMPVSLSVAQAEKRVVESKLEKAAETYSANIKKLQEATAKKIHELTAYLQIERAERAKCEQQLQEQKETIHQLTHHMKILRTQQQVSSQEYSLPEMHDIFSGHASDVLGDSHGHLFPEYSHPIVSAHTTGVHDLSSGLSNVHNNVHPMAHSNAHTATHTNTAAESFQLSRTVPLTPMSLTKPDARAHTQQQTSAHHHGTDHPGHLHAATHSGAHTGTGGISYRDTAGAPYSVHTPSHGPSQGNSGSVMGNEYYSTAHSIRSSIPPAPWEEGSLFAR